MGLGKLSGEELGAEKIPRARRMRTTKVNATSKVRINVEEEEEDDFRCGKREYLGFAIVERVKEGEEED